MGRRFAGYAYQVGLVCKCEVQTRKLKVICVCKPSFGVEPAGQTVQPICVPGSLKELISPKEKRREDSGRQVRSTSDLIMCAHSTHTVYKHTFYTHIYTHMHTRTQTNTHMHIHNIMESFLWKVLRRLLILGNACSRLPLGSRELPQHFLTVTAISRG